MDNSYQNTKDFISKHRKDNVKLLALQYSKNSHIDINEAITQIAGWQIAEKKFHRGQIWKIYYIPSICQWNNALQRLQLNTNLH